MADRNSAFGFFKDNSLEITLITTALVTIIYAFQINYDASSDLILGKFVGIVLNSVSAAASLVAFAAVLKTNGVRLDCYLIKGAV